MSPLLTLSGVAPLNGDEPIKSGVVGDCEWPALHLCFSLVVEDLRIDDGSVIFVEL